MWIKYSPTAFQAQEEKEFDRIMISVTQEKQDQTQTVEQQGINNNRHRPGFAL